MRYIVDGYNVVMRDSATAEMDLAAQREALVARLAARGGGLLGRGPITIVFDGVEEAAGGEVRGPVDVRYSRGESADDVIARLAVGNDVTVITSDTGLAARVRAEGAKVLGAECCFEARSVTRRPKRYPAASAGLPHGANEITAELKKLWLSDEE
ncbi:MAG: NYN domain-containing protein [Coriobacteriia bacterium]|nr:NYN domain-containing protein [Coriobacteriia bacterium]